MGQVSNLKSGKLPLGPLLRRIKFYFDAMAKTTDAYLYATDLINMMTIVSPNLVEDFDVPGTVLKDMNEHWMPLISDIDKEVFLNSIQDVFDNKVDVHDIEYRVKDRHGEYVWIHCHGCLLFNPDDKPYMFVGEMTRMSRRNQADDVTGLLNKYQFEHAIKVALNEYRATGQAGAVMIVGIDNFKIINETYNRYFGNQVLKLLSKQIKNILPTMFTLYRLDGDEFGIVYPGADEAEIEKLFYSIQTCLTRFREINGKRIFCTISGGTVFYPQAGRDPLVLQKHAEAALDMAKRDGKNRNCLFTREQYNRWVRSLSMRDSLKTSIENEFGDFTLFYQPQVDAKTKRVMGAEALLRWRNPRGKMVSPMEFVPVLEETKMIVPVGRWIVSEAVRTCRKWQDYLPGFRMSINISYDQLKDPTFGAFVLETIDDNGLDPRLITLELTESTIVSDWNFINQQFDTFRENGMSVAMDDFGTGYSSLSYLKNLSCDIIKIDREFVKNILENAFDCRLVEYTVQLCHFVGIKTCIEGIEREEEYKLVTDVCEADYIQGYLFGHPEPAEEFERKFFNAAGPEGNF